MPATDSDVSLKEIFETIHSRINRDRLLRNTHALWQAEFGQTFTCHHASARLAETLLREAGAQRIERIAFPADGKTVYQDKTLPLGWRATRGKLEVTHSPTALSDPIVADFERHPFHLIKGSIATPPEGIETRLVDQAAFESGADVRGSLVLLRPNTRAGGLAFRRICDAGALGLVSDFLVGREETPDAIPWVNACTEGPSWHTRADGRPFIGFAMSPRVGDELRAALREGEVRVRVFSDGERVEDQIEVVTGVIPGKEEQEIWLLAHLYEPLANDNSSGVACALEIARVLQTLYGEGILPPPRFTLRLVFAMEAYGFAAYAERRGGCLGAKVLCALNLDAIPIMDSDCGMALELSQSCSPSAADYVLEELCRSGLFETPALSCVATEGGYTDDRLLGDSTVGVPTLWAKYAPTLPTDQKMHLWHNSHQTMERIQPGSFVNVTALAGAWAAVVSGTPMAHRLADGLRLACNRLEEEQKFHSAQWLDYRLEIESARLRDFLRFGAEPCEIEAALTDLVALHHRLQSEIKAASVGPERMEHAVWNEVRGRVIRRKTRGQPRDLAAAPRDERRSSASGGTLAIVLALADGRRDLAELLLRAGWEQRKTYSPEEIRECAEYLRYLALYGYVEISLGTESACEKSSQ